VIYNKHFAVFVCYNSAMSISPTDNEKLISRAKEVLRLHMSKGRLFGDIGAAVVSKNGNVFTGVSLDVPGVGICAERNAISSMVTAGEYKIKEIVAVWRNEKDGKLYVLPPCGICRQFMKYVDESNLETSVILNKKEIIRLKELLPLREPEPLS
jgi:cytidine deaminase